MPVFELGRFLPYLINRAGARLAVAFSKEIARYGIELQEWRVLAALQAQGPCRLGDLAALTSIEMSTLSRLVGRMTRARLVERARENGDRRALQVGLAAPGRQVVAAIVPLAHEYERLALSGFTPGEAEALREMLSRVYRNLGGLPP
ncbi:MAG TPA: MarR family winged helix-turn-helix transcriptional regulator [Alphaproteobacteria bacterium]|nr:MarR family winged helix-turn-helix transcriptional regulator [Alphaproteobacteria bacterium]